MSVLLGLALAVILGMGLWLGAPPADETPHPVTEQPLQQPAQTPDSDRHR